MNSDLADKGMSCSDDMQNQVGGGRKKLTSKAKSMRSSRSGKSKEDKLQELAKDATRKQITRSQMSEEDKAAEGDRSKLYRLHISDKITIYMRKDS